MRLAQLHAEKNTKELVWWLMHGEAEALKQSMQKTQRPPWRKPKGE